MPFTLSCRAWQQKRYTTFFVSNAGDLSFGLPKALVAVAIESVLQ
jgi:hypothetical protein